MTTWFSDAKAEKDTEQHSFDNWPSVFAFCHDSGLTRMYERKLCFLG